MNFFFGTGFGLQEPEYLTANVMKNRIFLFVGLYLLLGSMTTQGSDRKSKTRASGENSKTEKTIAIQCSPGLEAITTLWADEYGKLNPGVVVNVTRMPQSPQEADLNSGADLSFVSGEYLEAMNGNRLWHMTVASDAVVPVISERNPFLDKIRKKGVTSDELSALFLSPGKQTWGTVLGNGQGDPVHYYKIAEKAVQARAAGFIGSDPSLMTGTDVSDAGELISAIRNDPYGIGFCRLIDVVNPENKQLVSQITILPIDKNRNGSIDQFENIYGNLNDFSRGVWIGKYPKALCRSIYTVSVEKPDNKADLAFLRWVVTGGQQLLTPTANGDLAYSDRLAKRIEILASKPAKVEMVSGSGFLSSNVQGLSIFSFVIIMLIPIILGFMIRDAVIRHRRQRLGGPAGSAAFIPVILDENSIEAPSGLYFDKSHTWAFMEKDGLVRIGIDDFLQHITGPLTRVKMKEEGERVKKGEPLFSIIQNGKQLTIHAPVSGTITARNNRLNSDTSVINDSPYTDGWVCMIEPTNWIREIRFLFLGSSYREWLKTEFSRFKDFLAASVKGNNAEYAHVVLQDGGEVKDGVMADLGPEIWEDFQTTFIDSDK